LNNKSQKKNYLRGEKVTGKRRGQGSMVQQTRAKARKGGKLTALTHNNIGGRKKAVGKGKI